MECESDVDLLSIVEVLTSCPLPTKPLDLLLILKGFMLREKRPEFPVPSFKPFLIEPGPGQARR